GQAAMFLTQYARKVTLVVRGGDLRKNMSSYLCDRVVANPQIEVRYHTQVTAIEGTEHIGAVHLRDEDGNVVREDTRCVLSISCCVSSSSPAAVAALTCRLRCWFVALCIRVLSFPPPPTPC